VTVQTQNFSFFGKFVTRGEWGSKKSFFAWRNLRTTPYSYRLIRSINNTILLDMLISINPIVLIKCSSVFHRTCLNCIISIANISSTFHHHFIIIMLSHTYDNLSIKAGKNNKFKHIDLLLYLCSFINLTITEQNNFFAFLLSMCSYQWI